LTKKQMDARAAPAWVAAVERNEIAWVCQLCANPSNIKAWHQTYLPGFNIVGWAIECDRTELAVAVLRLMPQWLDLPCIKWAPSHSPLVFACMRGKFELVETLIELGATLPTTTWGKADVVQQVRNVRARRAALLLMAGARFKCPNFTFGGFPRDVVGLLARALYATRVEVGVWED